MIDRDVPEPPHQQVAEILRARIQSGTLRGRLPSERALAVEFEVAGTTIRKAIRLLAAEGLIRTSPRWGTFVVGEGHPTKPHRPVPPGELQVSDRVRQPRCPAPGQPLLRGFGVTLQPRRLLGQHPRT